MQNIKLHEATKQFGVSNKLAMFFLEKKNVPVKSHSSVISMEQLVLLREFSDNKEKFASITREFDKLEREEKRKKRERERDKENKASQPEPQPQPVTTKEVKPEETPRMEQPLPSKPDPRPEQKPEPRHEVRPERRPERRSEPHTEPRHEQRTEPKPEPRPERRRERHPESLPVPRHEARPERRPEPRHEHRPEQRRDARPEQRPEQRRDARPEQRPEQRREKRPERRPERRPEPRHEAKPRPQHEPKFERKPTPPERITGPVEEKVPRKDRERDRKLFEKPKIPKNLKTKKEEEDVERKREFKKKKKDSDKGKIFDDTELSETVEEEIPKSVPSPVPAKRPPERVERPRQEHFQHGDRDKRGKRFDQRRGKPTPQPAPEPPKPKVRTYNLPELIQIPDFISLKELTEKLNIKLKDIEERMKGSNKEYVTNQILDVEEVKAICAEFKVEVDIIPFEDAVFYGHIEKSKAQLTPRAPVVTVMGHVDHGKTTLLDTLRHTRVAEREAGGITQKIGAYKLTYNNTDIIFLDTPGHEAFTNIRARGAKVTDIVILIVAANDGVKPQTIEAINHAKAAGVPIIVAINKIDLPGADPTKVKQELSRYGIVVEDWGGDVVSVEISAKLNKNLDALLEMVILVSEMLEIKAYKNISARGTIIESRLDPKLGPLGTVLLQHGTVNRGDFFICGESVGKIKSIFDDQGKVLNSAEVPLPIEIMGFENVPEAGERFQVVDDVEKVRKVIDMRKLREKEARKEESISDKKLSLQNLFDRLEENKTKVFPLIIKADNFSSAEVLENILLKQSQEGLKINIMHKGIGNITEGDILLASTSGSIILGFNVKAPQKILGLAKREQIEIKLYNVIYHLIEDIARAIKGEMAPEYIETKIGSVEVLQVFKISKLGNIAGCLVKEGKVTNKSKLKVFRDNDFVFEGEVETLRRIKNEASEVNAGTECGIRIKNFNGIEIGDTLEAYEVKIKE